MLLAVTAVGVVLHVTIRDAWGWPSCMVFYALPRPLLAGCALASAGLMRQAAGRLQCLIVAHGLGLCFWTLAADCAWHVPHVSPRTDASWRVASWNASHLPRGRAVAAEVMRTWKADVIGLVEAGPTDAAALAEWRRLLPGYSVESPRSGALLIARGDIALGPVATIYRQSEAMPAIVQINGVAGQIVLVDITSEITHCRIGPLAGLSEYLDGFAEPPQIVMGDFNTPTDSLGFQRMGRTYRSGFTSRGWGYRPTWPIVCPVLELDYIWLRSDVAVQACRHGWTAASDHRPVVADVTIATTGSIFLNSSFRRKSQRTGA